jgi:hypothetical protein
MLEGAAQRVTPIGSRRPDRAWWAYHRRVADDVSLDVILDDLAVAFDAGPAVALIADRLGAGAPRDEVADAAARAAASVWTAERAAEVRDGLARLREEYGARLAAVDAAEQELGHPPERNAVALALVARAAVELWARARRSFDRVALLEDELSRAAPAEHRSRALSVAAAVIPVLELDTGEVESVVSRFLDAESRDWLARQLATDERRRAMRRALGRLADAGDEAFPLATAAITALLAEPMPRDPAEDELWVGLVVGLAQQQLDFEPG